MSTSTQTPQNEPLVAYRNLVFVFRGAAGGTSGLSVDNRDVMGNVGKEASSVLSLLPYAKTYRPLLEIFSAFGGSGARKAAFVVREYGAPTSAPRPRPRHRKRHERVKPQRASTPTTRVRPTSSTYSAPSAPWPSTCPLSLRRSRPRI